MKKRILAIGLSILISLSATNLIFAKESQETLTRLQSINALANGIDKNKLITVQDFAILFSKTATYEHGGNSMELLRKKNLILPEEKMVYNNKITEIQALKIVLRYMGFTDLNDAEYIKKASELKLTNGLTIDVNSETLNYSQASQILSNYLDYKEKSTEITQVKKYELSDFFSIGESIGYFLTSDGKSLYYLKSTDNNRNVFKKDLLTGKEDQITKIEGSRIANYFLKDDTIVYLKDFGGDENFHLFTTDKSGKEIDLTPFDKTRVIPINLLEDSEVKDEILIQMNKDNKEQFKLYRLNVKTGKIDEVNGELSQFTGFISDNNGKVRVALYSDGVNTAYFYRENEEDEFKMVNSYDYSSNLSIVMFAEDNKSGYALSNVGRDTVALVKIDIPTGKELAVIEEHPNADISSAFAGVKSGTLGVVNYVTDKVNVTFYDKEFKEIYEAAQKATGSESIIMSNITDDLNMCVVTAYSDINRGVAYLFDRANNKATVLSDTNTIDSNQLNEMIPISYQSRDGLTINGYLTLPKNKEAKNLPVIVNPHGGPWARDVWAYNPEVQFLANRGFAVLQINFRGSTGYGREFLEAGYKQWGLNMQNDITDGVEWVKSIGLADPDRIGIYGASYGGYAALAGITFTPDLYAAAVDYVGVSNLFTFLDTIPPYWVTMRTMLYDMVGNPETDKVQFEKTSPVFHADKIKVPVFIAQGANDPRVNKAESDQMVDALKKNNIDVTYMIKEGEGHGFANPENQVEFYTRMEKFFEEHLLNKKVD